MVLRCEKVEKHCTRAYGSFGKNLDHCESVNRKIGLPLFRESKKSAPGFVVIKLIVYFCNFFPLMSRCVVKQSNDPTSLPPPQDFSFLKQTWLTS